MVLTEWISREGYWTPGKGTRGEEGALWAVAWWPWFQPGLGWRAGRGGGYSYWFTCSSWSKFKTSPVNHIRMSHVGKTGLFVPVTIDVWGQIFLFLGGGWRGDGPGPVLCMAGCLAASLTCLLHARSTSLQVMGSPNVATCLPEGQYGQCLRSTGIN